MEVNCLFQRSLLCKQVAKFPKLQLKSVHVAPQRLNIFVEFNSLIQNVN